MIGVRVDPRTQRDLQVAARKLKRHGNKAEIRREMIKGLRAAAKPGEQAAKASAMSLPANTGQSTGLRRRIASAIGIQVRTSRNALVRIRVARRKMGDQASLPQRMNRPGQWRHPVYGNREMWVTQTSRAGWFDKPILATRPKAVFEMAKVLQRIIRRMK